MAGAHSRRDGRRVPGPLPRRRTVLSLPRRTVARQLDATGLFPADVHRDARRRWTLRRSQGTWNQSFDYAMIRLLARSLSTEAFLCSTGHRFRCPP